MVDPAPAATPVLGQVESFKLGTDDWEQYTERLEQYFVANSITDDAKKRAVFITVIGGKAYSLLSDLLAPTKPAEKSYQELVEVLKTHLKPKPVIIAERFHFHQRRQKEGEDISTYMAALRRLADKCEFGPHLNEALRDRFVCGLHREATQRKLLTMEKLTLQKAYETAYGMEAADKQTSEFQALKASSEAGVNSVVGGNNPTPSTHDKPACYRCGKANHTADACFYKSQKCRACGKFGHIAKKCRSWKFARKRRDHRADHMGCGEDDTDGTQSEPEDVPMMNIQAVELKWSNAGIMLDLQVDGVPLQMELDTGASVSIVSEKTWKTILRSPKLKKSSLRLKTYSGHRLQVLGQRVVKVQYGDQACQLPLVVVSGSGPGLFGRNWLEHIQLNWGSIKKMTTGPPLEELLQEYEEVFQPELGKLKGMEATLEVQSGAHPKFCKPRSMPYAIKDAVERDIERLVEMGVLEKVKCSEWAAPIVTVPKADGGIRICGDYKVTVNPTLRVDQYPMPTPEDLFATLAGGKAFTKLDLAHAYQQVVLAPESRKYVTVNTHKGLYQYKRLPYGVASAPAIFQEIMEKLLHGIPGVVVYIDDILVTGKGEEEHLANLRQVLSRIKESGLRLKRPKCRFMADYVDYLGYRIDKDGLHTLPEKVTAVVEAPKPDNIQELRAFLGLVNYYGRFIKQLSTLTHPLNRLLCKGTPWVWDRACQQAFTTLKSKLASTEVLAHYDVHLPLRLDCDASAYGVGAVLAHVFPDGTERPIAYASRSLNAAEKNYAQIEKEGLALIFGVKKFHKYIYGRKFTLVTDHQPLMAILGPKKGIPTLAAARLQRWALLLLGYQYELEFRRSEQHSNADAFSRLPRQCSGGPDGLAAGTTAFNLHQIEAVPLTAKELREATWRDPQLRAVLRFTREGWPREPPKEKELQPYHRKRAELSIEAGCLFWGTRVIVPKKLQGQVLRELHASHPGIVRMKGVARAHVWWPQLSADIEKTSFNCDACQSERKQPPAAPLQPWPWPSTPWDRIHVDYAGPLLGYMYLVVVDSHSKWLEVFPVKTTTTEKTIEVLRSLFARYGLPRQLVSDNGPQFTSREFEEFMLVNGVKHTKSPPYHPATNGEAERFVQTFKRSLRAGREDEGSVHQKLARFLLTYRTTPQATTGVCPSELFLKRPVRTRLDLLKPSVEEHVLEKQGKQKHYHDGHSQTRVFKEGQTVLVRNLREGAKWLRGVVLTQLGPVTYEVKVNGQVWKRHAEQLLNYKGTTVPDVDPTPLPADPTDIVELPVTSTPDTSVAVETEVVPPEPAVESPSLPAIPDSPEPTHRPIPELSGTPATPPSPQLAATPRSEPTKIYPRRGSRQPPDYLRPTW